MADKLIAEDLQRLYIEDLGFNTNNYVRPLIERTSLAEQRVKELEQQIAGSQALADEKCKWFLIRAEKAETENERLKAPVSQREMNSQSWWSDDTAFRRAFNAIIAARTAVCAHERLNEDGYCHSCGEDCRGIH
jgi:hypothetical protein